MLRLGQSPYTHSFSSFPQSPSFSSLPPIYISPSPSPPFLSPFLTYTPSLFPLLPSLSSSPLSCALSSPLSCPLLPSPLTFLPSSISSLQALLSMQASTVSASLSHVFTTFKESFQPSMVSANDIQCYTHVKVNCYVPFDLFVGWCVTHVIISVQGNLLSQQYTVQL